VRLVAPLSSKTSDNDLSMSPVYLKKVYGSCAQALIRGFESGREQPVAGPSRAAIPLNAIIENIFVKL